MSMTRRLLAAAFAAVLSLSAVACSAEGNVGEGGAEGEIEGEEGGEGEGGEGGEEGGGEGGADGEEAETYTVQAGDNLGAIAEETGVPVETIEELNPELDPQALVTGQEIKLRE